jgi:hypothetical protein
VVVVSAILSDNGDNDGWADTNETVEMRIGVYSRMGVPLTGVTARLATYDDKIACIEDSALSIGDLPDRTLLISEEAFRFTLADVGREQAANTFSMEFEIDLSCDQFEQLPGPQRVVLDLDLDAVGGAGNTSFFEGFEGGLGALAAMPLDDDLNPPDEDLGDFSAGVANADGYRCQYNDPDWQGSLTFGEPEAENCFPNPDYQPDAFHFQITANRAFSGTHSLYWGEMLDEDLGFTTPTAQLEAVYTTEPVNLAWRDVCSVHRTVECADAVDCPVGEECVSVSPTLSFKHQVSFVDHRTVSMAGSPNETLDRSVVQVQRVDAQGAPVGDWTRVEPHVNVYDTAAFPYYTNCAFDPTDDGNDEEEFFSPEDPARRYGPSSTCAPQRCFVHQGDTAEDLDTSQIGDASDGPGWPGAVGDGIWVEPRFSLARYRGQRVRLRFLQTGLKVDSYATWEWAFMFNPDPRDDGWFIDDVMIQDTLVEPATILPDTKPNLDLSGPGPVCDCAPADAGTWAPPGNARDLTLTPVDGSPEVTALSWDAPLDPGSNVVTFDVLGSVAPDGFESPASASCLATTTGLSSQDPSIPGPGSVRFFLVRASNACGGSLGTDSAGAARIGIPCS